jgi:hypothetical protein
MGPMRITSDFYQRMSKLPEVQAMAAHDMNPKYKETSEAAHAALVSAERAVHE